MFVSCNHLFTVVIIIITNQGHLPCSVQMASSSCTMRRSSSATDADLSEGYANLSADYYDIMITGKTGLGKSTLGNKLLQSIVVAGDHEPRGMFSTIFVKGVGTSDKCHGDLPRFLTEDDVENDKKQFSVTTRCQVTANERTKTRVLDTPGFFPSNLEPGMTTEQANLQIVRWIVYEQQDKRMKFKRLLYFFPGTPRKADGALQEELRVMHYFFGPAIFGHMVVIATQEFDIESVELRATFCDKVQKVFCAAAKAVTSSDCRLPVVYIGLNDAYDDVLQRIKTAPVIDGNSNSYFVPAFRENVCARCGDHIYYSSQATPIGVLKDSVLEKYEESKCHPCFIQKYSMAEKIAGGIGHVVTLGIAYGVAAALCKESWPSFINSDEKCPHCQGSPGSKGCCRVEEQVEVEDQHVTVYHTNKL